MLRQDPAIIMETGLCSWRSGRTPKLALRQRTRMLKGRMALFWTGATHDTPSLVAASRDYDAIEAAGRQCHDALVAADYAALCAGTLQSYAVQRAEGMFSLPTSIEGMTHFSPDSQGSWFNTIASLTPAVEYNLPFSDGIVAAKYCGGGFGGYAVFLFSDRASRDLAVAALPQRLKAIEPFSRRLSHS